MNERVELHPMDNNFTKNVQNIVLNRSCYENCGTDSLALLYRFLVFLLVFFMQSNIQAQTRVEIPESSSWSMTLIDELEVMSDEQHQWSAESLFANSDDLFAPNSADAKPVLHNYWAKFKLANTNESEQWLSFESYYWDYVTLYFRDSTGHVTVIPFGILSNPNNHKFLILPQTEYVVLVNFESGGQFRREDNINLVIKSTIAALESKTFTNYLDGISFGIMFGFALYNLFLFISLRDRTYFWYSLYILFLAISFATLFAAEPSKLTQFFTPNYPSFPFYLKKVSEPIIIISYINFVRNFLLTKNRHPIWDKGLKIFMVLIILQFLANVTGIYHFTGITRVMIWNTATLCCVILAFIYYFHGYAKARFLIVGQFFILIGVVVTATHYAGFDLLNFLPKSEFFNYFRSPSSYFAFGAVESIVFSFAMADKYNMMQKESVRMKIEKEKEKSEVFRLRELDNFKSRFYSNITHEFRTPLTVILGMTDALESELQTKMNPPIKNAVKMIHRNGSNLLSLVNEMLDLSKLESGRMEMSLVQINVIPFIKYLGESFHSFAQEDDIHFTVYSEIDELVMDIDSQKLATIISNLLSNAIKFTPPLGKIILHIQNDSDMNLVIKVTDTGIGIAEEELQHVFDRFYQADTAHTRKGEGSGIGLSLTKELVQLLGGQISVISTPNEGSVFKVELPITQNAPKTTIESLKLSHQSVTEGVDSEINQKAGSKDEDLPLVLIIEDNKDVAYYLKQCLKDQYKTMHAINGIEGLEMAFEHIPDIIISDVMMPGKDGYEVCSMLKEDQRTDHIPIVLLTAKVTTKDRVIGLTHGADAYLTKPFVKEELFARLEQLLFLRKKLINKFQLGQVSKIMAKQPINAETKFITKVIQLIHEDLDNSTFGVSELSTKLGLSESQVYRKLKAISGKSTAVFIRTIRLESAREQLQTTDKTVSEVAYAVGFNDPSWFSRAFKEEYGFAPSSIFK
ncbi:ATP-binding protein [Zobellia laminariae]|uniref:ATP-binding protein n=2 Tax=Zobellia laminariae TaxID=248906 RepID=UPI0026F46D75|nr:ATP-binding protein [Zobellia laminariae]WKX75066.1 ATP-binding protein [Zobellia laminariae]